MPELNAPQIIRLLAKEQAGQLSEEGQAALFRERRRTGQIPGALQPGDPLPTVQEIQRGFTQRELENPLFTRGGRQPLTPEERRMSNEIALSVAAPMLGPAGLGARTALAAAGGAGGSLVSEFGDPSASTQEALLRAGGAAAGAAGGELLGGVIGQTFMKIVPRAIAGRLSPGAKGALESIEQQPFVPPEDFARSVELFGGPAGITPATATESRTIDLIENVLEASFTGGGFIRRTKQRGIQLISNSLDLATKDISQNVPKELVGEWAKLSLEQSDTVFKNFMQKTFNAIRADIPEGELVDLRPLKLVARDLLERPEIVKSESVASMLRNTAKLPDGVDFGSAQYIRSPLLAVDRAINEVIPAAPKKVAGQLANVMTKQMETTANRAGVQAQWKTANAIWAKGAEMFNSKLITNLVNKNPEEVYKLAVKAGSPSEIAQARNAIVLDPVTGEATEQGKRTWALLQGQLFEDMLRTARPDPTEFPVGKKLLNQMEKFAGGTRALKELFQTNPEALTNFEKLSGALTTIQKKVQEGTGKVFIQLTQASAITGGLGVAAGGFFGGGIAMGIGGLAGATSILIAPAALGFAITRKPVVRWLTRSLTLDPTTTASQRAVTQLLAAAAREGLTVDRDSKGQIVIGAPRAQ